MSDQEVSTEGAEEQGEEPMVFINGEPLRFDLKIVSEGHSYGLYGRDKAQPRKKHLIFAGVSCGKVQLGAMDCYTWMPSGEKWQILFFVLGNHNDLSAALLVDDKGDNFVPTPLPF